MSSGGGGSRTRVLKCDTETSTGLAASYKDSAQGWRSSMAFLTPETALIFPALLQTFKQVSPGLRQATPNARNRASGTRDCN